METFKRSCNFEGIYIFHLFNKLFLFGTLLFIFTNTIKWDYNKHENNEFSEVIRYNRNLSYSPEGMELYDEGYFHGGGIKLENNMMPPEFEINMLPEYYGMGNMEYGYGIKNKQILKNIDTNYGDIQRITNLDSLKTNNFNENNNVATKTKNNSKILYGFQKDKKSQSKPKVENKKVLSNNKIELSNKQINGDINMHKEVKFSNKVDDINIEEYIKLHPNSDVHRVLNQSGFKKNDGVAFVPKINHDYTNKKNISIEEIPKIVESRENKKKKSKDMLKNIPHNDHGLNKLNQNEKERIKVVRNESITTILDQIENDSDQINSIIKSPNKQNNLTVNVKMHGPKNLKNNTQIEILEKLKEEIKPEDEELRIIIQEKEKELKESIKIQEQEKELKESVKIHEKEKEKTKKKPFYKVIFNKIKKKFETYYIRGFGKVLLIVIFFHLIVLLLIICYVISVIRPKTNNNTPSNRGSRL
ncbi:Plasmodium exported protein, unknown function [Plasmodium vinckei vinckei]|uniref:Uncharacterized protein n=1 Tax=Plasmodium vinckei vinckei TaxID=54757 RepID=A0A081IA90_PLAVN|nr:Plasmodium exported protein, unknown function [Plasmodium vinckei vinckei]KEG00598.1 hypothetical protein YYE_04427 [Plasmodium vinckei vinckei]VEV54707.1 Plasmodium exported protein, unknown function [Plasmodium vinckei vinckei]